MAFRRLRAHPATLSREVDRLRGLVTDLNWLAETDYGELGLILEASSIYELLTAEGGTLAAAIPGPAG